jgi:uncharacterized protein YuzE
MSEAYLEVTYRRGRALAAYLYLPRRTGQKSYRTRAVEPGLLVDYSRSGKPIGIEITAPAKVSATKLNRLLRRLGQPELKRAHFAPLRAA